MEHFTAIHFTKRINSTKIGTAWLMLRMTSPLLWFAHFHDSDETKISNSQLDEPVEFSWRIQPVCLGDDVIEEIVREKNLTLLAAGWGQYNSWCYFCFTCNAAKFRRRESNWNRRQSQDSSCNEGDLLHRGRYLRVCFYWNYWRMKKFSLERKRRNGLLNTTNVERLCRQCFVLGQSTVALAV